jgi:hypothetical protein
MPTPGIVHNRTRLWALDQDCAPTVGHVGTKNNFAKFPVEKPSRTPYGTRSYLPGAQSQKPDREEAGFPPVFLVRKVARKTLLFFGCAPAIAEGTSG